MEEKESTVSGSAGGNSHSESPPPVSSAGGEMPPPPPPPPPQVMKNVPVNLDSNEGSMVSGGGGGPVAGKKKRGRPRKYDADGNLVAPFYTSPKSAPPPPPPGFSDFYLKKGRGRPAGSGNWKLFASFGEVFANTAGWDFTPHVVTVSTGEDVAGKILSFSQKGPRGICVLTANGAVSNVTIHQPGSCGGLLTYEGRFEILSLTGSFTVSDNDGKRSRTGGLSVSLAGPDGRVFGGAIAGLLVAASPIQMVIGSFMLNGYQAHKRKQQQYATTPGKSDTVTVATPISQVVPDANINFAPTSQLPAENHGADEDNSTPDEQHQSSSPASEKSNELEPVSAEMQNPDMNESLPVE